MTYHLKTRTLLAGKNVSKSLGMQLGKLALRKNVSVQDIAANLGASRSTVYSWFAGHGVTNAYRAPVLALIADLQKK